MRGKGLAYNTWRGGRRSQKLSKILLACNYARLLINLGAGIFIFLLFSPRDFYKWFLCVRTSGSLIFLPCAAFKYAWPSGSQIELSAQQQPAGNEIFSFNTTPEKSRRRGMEVQAASRGMPDNNFVLQHFMHFTRVHTPLMPVCAKW
jgi:hypothetical protein